MSLVRKAFYSGIGRVFSLPRLSVPLILTLGLTLGAVLTVIAISSTLFLQPLQGVPNEDKLHTYSINVPFSDDFIVPFFEMKRLAHFYDDYSALGEWASISTQTAKISINNTQYEVNKHKASSNILTVLGSKLIKGQDVNITSPERFVWISNSLWQSAFSNKNSALGSIIQLEDKNYTIAGVIEDVTAIKSTGIINSKQVWQISNLPQKKSEPESNALNGDLENIIVLQKDNRRILTENEIKEWSTRYVENNFTAEAAATFKMFTKNFELNISNKNYRKNLLGSSVSLIVTLLITVVGLLLMAALNLLNLFIAHYQARSKEFAIQLSLGASLNKLRLLIFLENLPCFCLAAMTGLLSAGWIIKLLPILAGNNLPLLATISLDFPTVIAALLIVMLLTLIFSLLATIDVNKHSLVDNLNSSGKGIQAQNNQTLSKVLMVLQLSLASILLTSSVMLALQSYEEVFGEVGYTLGNSYQINMEPKTKGPKNVLYEHLETMVLSNHDTTMMTFIESNVSGSKVIVPSSGPLNGSFTIQTYKEENTNFSISYEKKYFNEGYFSAFKIPLIAGENITKEQIENDEQIVIVDAAMAKIMYPKLSFNEIIGKKLRVSDAIIQGIVPTLKSLPGHLKTHQLPIVYNVEPSSSNYLTYTVMMPEGKKLTTSMIEDKFKAQFPLFKNLEITALNDTWAEMTQMHRTSLWIIVTVTLLTIILAAIGVAGLTQMTTNHRKYELAVRMATGAKQSLLVRFILKDALWMLVLGLGLGFAFSVFGYEQLQKHLTMLPEFNDVAMTILDLGLIFIVFLSVIIPAWRVISADPMQALREE
ncbi:ABC transporter permease [Colwellia sp. BRX8-7]|jgi:macrolide transport system ATP-binding/permease protein|uniref:ABC transporter permease n=1 Tax=Colwellia sp. BRX8-7 TaxID=2759833 RepID=UPI0015F47BEE|nr:ABC transporter permease [Colwellia sp. BRX8-7]MBA6336297.1 ABC transporter permease [Colwellia sp. BRX8-7]